MPGWWRPGSGRDRAVRKGTRPRWIRTSLAPPDGCFLVAYLDGVAVACAGWRNHGPDAELKRMFVAPVARGRGLARAVLEVVEQTARAAGRRRVILETGDKQPEAIALYRSAGYTDIPNFGYYADEPGCVCLAKALV
jgi:GNAT superfamily N-acetyltransferase